MTATMNPFKRIMHAFTESLERSAQARTREYLLGLSDRHLDDMGLSRELLKQGPSAWPWRKSEDPLIASWSPAAMHEPNTDSDAQAANVDRRRPGMEQAALLNRRNTDTKLAA
jgi:uncharacterized protein YjiS (DUF1127 family)